jgi:hypothetical protein
LIVFFAEERQLAAGLAASQIADLHLVLRDLKGQQFGVNQDPRWKDLPHWDGKQPESKAGSAPAAASASAASKAGAEEKGGGMRSQLDERNFCSVLRVDLAPGTARLFVEVRVDGKVRTLDS